MDPAIQEWLTRSFADIRGDIAALKGTCEEARAKSYEAAMCAHGMAVEMREIAKTANRAETKADDCNERHEERTERELDEAKAKLARRAKPDSDHPDLSSTFLTLSKSDTRKLVLAVLAALGVGAGGTSIIERLFQ